jgi:UDP-N-acetylglucosamine diphosphorylase/glucosamine-1-phosphate N-acetyltransferase
MHYTLFDTEVRYRLLPFTHTRAVADVRCGILTMRERWEKLLGASTGTITEAYIQKIYTEEGGDKTGNGIYVNAAVFGTKELAAAINKLEAEQKLLKDDVLIAFHSNSAVSFDSLINETASHTSLNWEGELQYLNNVWDIFALNDAAIKADYALVGENRVSEAVPAGVTVVGKNLFIEAGAKVGAGTIINTEAGPVYIGKEAEILEGTLIRGPLAMCEHSVLKMGAKIYGATTIGPGCKVGGEINNVVFFANSNKSHDGYLGNAVIGEWCNLGADTNCSNLKNNYEEVKIWSEHNNKSIKTGLTFCGLLMGDHSKCAINTAFNTGTVVGVSCNIYGSGFPEKYVPSFCWGGSEGMTTYKFERAMETANRMMARRGKKLTEAETEMYQHVFEKSQHHRELFAHV